MDIMSINSYNRRDSFGLGWADQWDYKFNDEKLATAAHSRVRPKSKLGKENAFSDQKPPSSSSSMQKRPVSQNLVSKKKLMDLNRKVLSAANSSAGVAKAAANTGAHKVKAGTSMGMKWLKKQCSVKTLK